jgi:excisionase family DNA binding protein
MMLDTIGVQYPIPINKDALASWRCEKNPTAKGSISNYRLVVHGCNDTELTFRYRPYSYNGIPLTQVEFSLPNLVLGDNVHMIYDIMSAIDHANHMIPTVPGIPEVDLWQGTLYRLDVCYNHDVGDLVPFYIKALQTLEFTRRTTRSYDGQGVQYGNKQVALKLYDKERSYIDKKVPVDPIAHGILRQETTYRRKSLKRLTGLKNPTLRDITIEMLVDALEDELKCLGLLDRSIGNYDTTLSKLCETYGTDAGFCYFGALAAKVEYPSRETVVSASNIHPRALDRRLKKVLAAGPPLTFTKTDEPLPPLTIDRDMVMKMVKQEASVMKYQVIPIFERKGVEMDTISENTNNLLQSTRLLRPNEIAALLNISRSFTYHLLQTGAIPVVRLGKSCRVKPQDLAEYIERNRYQQVDKP